MAMCLMYDENLADNTFFQTLRKDYTDLFYKAILEGCVVAVPRAGSFPNFVSLDDILGHVLLPNEEMPESHFTTLSGKEIKICNRIVTVLWDNDYDISTQILFDETFYTEDYMKYKVICLEHPLEPKSDRDGVLSISSLRDCIEFLNDNASKNFTDELDNEISEFLKNKHDLENASLQTLKELSLELYDKCFDGAMRDRRIKEKILNPHSKNSLRLAVESYIHQGIYKSLFKCICANTAEEDGNLNKIIRNCLDLQLKDLGVRAEFHDLIPKAKTEIGKLTGYSTVMGKLGCLKKMLAVLSKDPESGGVLAADDLLPIIIIILLNVNITNWLAHLKYLKNFRFSSLVCAQDEDEYLITTLEAALEHIASGVFLPVPCVDSKGQLELPINETNTNKTILFEHVARGNVDEMQRVIDGNCGKNSLSLCHPLCTCTKCQSAADNNGPSVHSKDENGLTVLHVAAKYGQPACLDYFFSQNVDVDPTDNFGRTPLHHAAFRGHQSCLLFLIQLGAEINACDNALNTPLHLSAASGHLACVKALIYHCEQEGTKLLMNAQNHDGETPLHIACRYGFLAIVQILVTYGSDPSIINRRKLSSFQLANNLKVSKLLTHSRPKFKCNLNVRTINFDFLDEGFGRIMGEMPQTSKIVKKVDKMIKAVTHGDTNLACFYLGLDPINTPKQCHPLCSCPTCKKDPTKITHDKLGINMCDTEGNTALHVAVQQGLLDLTQLLIKNNAIVNVQNRKLSTPLMLACQQQRILIASILLEAGCSVNLQDSRGNTALHYVCSSPHSNKRLVEILLQHSPKLSLKNKTGRTALQEAETRMYIGIVNMIRDAESKSL